MASSNGFTRRQVFKTSAAVGGAIAAAPLLSACGSGKASTKNSGVADKSAVQAVAADVQGQSSAVTPDIPVGGRGANGAASDPAFLTYPANPPKSVTGAVGRGGSYTAVSPLWGSVPAPGNSYYAAVNQAIGATLTDSPSDGNNYATMLATRFASGNIPDWLDVPGWNVSAIQNFAEGVDKYFKDLTPFLGGDKVLDYPNLAAIPTGGWQAAVWNGKLYGIPLWTSAANIPGHDVLPGRHLQGRRRGRLHRHLGGQAQGARQAAHRHGQGPVRLRGPQQLPVPDLQHPVQQRPHRLEARRHRQAGQRLRGAGVPGDAELRQLPGQGRPGPPRRAGRRLLQGQEPVLGRQDRHHLRRHRRLEQGRRAERRRGQPELRAPGLQGLRLRRRQGLDAAVPERRACSPT